MSDGFDRVDEAEPAEQATPGASDAEPTAVENAYRFVKAAFWRRMRNVAQVYGYEPLLRTVMAEIDAAITAIREEVPRLRALTPS